MNETIKVAVMGAMRKQPDGNWQIDKAESVYADIPVSEIAELLIKGFGGVPVLDGEAVIN